MAPNDFAEQINVSEPVEHVQYFIHYICIAYIDYLFNVSIEKKMKQKISENQF